MCTSWHKGHAQGGHENGEEAQGGHENGEEAQGAQLTGGRQPPLHRASKDQGDSLHLQRPQALPHSNTPLSSFRGEGKREVLRQGQRMTFGLKSITRATWNLPEFYAETVKVKLCSQQLCTRR